MKQSINQLTARSNEAVALQSATNVESIESPVFEFINEEDNMNTATLETTAKQPVETTAKQPVETTAKQPPVFNPQSELFVSYMKYAAKKQADLEAVIETLKQTSNKDRSASQKMKLYKETREKKIITLILHIMEKVDANVFIESLTEEDLDFLESLIGFTTAKRGPTVITVKEGDRILELLEKYDTVNNIGKKLTEAARKIGCYLDYTTGTIRRI